MSTTEWAQTSGNEHKQIPNKHNQLVGTSINKHTITHATKGKSRCGQVKTSARTNKRREWWVHTYAEGRHTCNTSGAAATMAAAAYSNGDAPASHPPFWGFLLLVFFT